MRLLVCYCLIRSDRGPPPRWPLSEVKTEQINPAAPDWRFKTIPGPSKSDIAAGAKVALYGKPVGTGCCGRRGCWSTGDCPATVSTCPRRPCLSNGNATVGGSSSIWGR